MLVTSVPLPDQFLDNVLASPQGAITGEKFERFEAAFVGAGDTLSAALAALLATGVELHAAVGEALAFLDQALDAGFRPGMGNVIPDRFFWALPEDGEEEGAEPEKPSPARPTPPPRREPAPCPLSRAHRPQRTQPCSNAPSASSPAASIRRCAPFAPSAARRASSPAPKAPYLWDAEGKRYIDYIGSWGPMILGHGHPAVLEAVQQAADDGLSFGAPTEREIELAEEILALRARHGAGAPGAARAPRRR